jgi:hypothetical protein
MRWDTGRTIPGRAVPVARGQLINPDPLPWTRRPGRWLAGRDGRVRLCAFAPLRFAADCSVAALVLQIAAKRAYVRRSAADRRSVRRSAAMCCSSTNVL